MTFRAARFTVFVALAAPLFASSVPGIRNFDQVGPGVYRGGQPTAQGFQYLASLGVRTVIDLRESGERSNIEQKEVAGAGMTYVNVPMTGLTPPSQDEITKILGLMENASAGPVFVHCQRGADRTGAVIAAYHIDHDNWDNTRALKDAKAHSMSFFQVPRQNFILHFQAHANVPAAAQPVAVPATALLTN